MTHPERKPTMAVVVVLPVANVEQVRNWLRQRILENEENVPVKEFMFEAYQKLGQR